MASIECSRLYAQNMRKALAQNPNLLRTLLGLSFTLVFFLSYAVYGATVDSTYFVYSNDVEESEMELELLSNSTLQRSGETWTTWTWEFTSEGANLTWINASILNSPSDGEIRLLNTGDGYWSHTDLGNPDAELFSCAELCFKNGSHTSIIFEGEAKVTGLTHYDPARRDGGTVRAADLEEAMVFAGREISYDHGDNVWQIIVQLQGEHSEVPQVSATTVNEAFGDIEQFELDPATELVWALAAVIGCFAMVLVPSFSVYFAANAKRNKAEGQTELVIESD